MRDSRRRRPSAGMLERVGARGTAAHVRAIDPLPARCEQCQHVRAEEALRRINAALEEQARSIGQALHDEAGQILTAAYKSLAEATELVPASARKPLDAVKTHLEVIEEQLRRLAYELRPRILDDLGLVPALRFLAQGVYLRRGITMEFGTSLKGPLPAAVETAVYRLMQEAITNISRHSSATRIELELQEQGGELQCRVCDNGIGFDPASLSNSGLGLVGIRDRLNALGATLTIRSAPGHGTELLATIPLEERNGGTYSARGRSSNCA
jgi:signal transduction histidine kinase